MQHLSREKLGVDSNKIPGRPAPVIDPDPGGWSGPVRVFKHPKDQSWAGRTLNEQQKGRAKKDIDDMADEVLKMMFGRQAPFNGRLFDPDLYETMVNLRQLPFFNIYV